jgi:hypothetical protein
LVLVAERVGAVATWVSWVMKRATWGAERGGELQEEPSTVQGVEAVLLGVSWVKPKAVCREVEEIVECAGRAEGLLGVLDLETNEK